MPFRSNAQRRYMFLKHPSIAKRWAEEYPHQGHLPEHVKEHKEKHKKKKHKTHSKAAELVDLITKTARAKSEGDTYNDFENWMGALGRHPTAINGSFTVPLRTMFTTLGKDYPGDQGIANKKAEDSLTTKEAFKAGFLLKCAEQKLTIDQIIEKTDKLIESLEKKAFPSSASELADKAFGGTGALLFGTPIAAGGLLAFLNHKMMPQEKTNLEDIKRDELTNTFLRLADEAKRKRAIKEVQATDPSKIVAFKA